MTISQQPLVLWRRSWRQNLIHFVAYKFCMGHFCIRAKLKKWTDCWKLTLFDYLSDYIFCKIYRHHGWPLGPAYPRTSITVINMRILTKATIQFLRMVHNFPCASLQTIHCCQLLKAGGMWILDREGFPCDGKKCHNWQAIGRIKPISKERERAQLATQSVIVNFKPIS